MVYDYPAGTLLSPQYVAGGGNPGGHVCADDPFTPTGGVWFWRAPSKFLGDVSDAYTRTLTYDLKQSSEGNPFDWHEVVLIGGGMTLVFDLPGEPGAGWTSFAVPIHESAGWRKDEVAGPAPTHQEMLNVLSSLTDLRIRGEYRVGPDSGCLDNVVLGH